MKDSLHYGRGLKLRQILNLMSGVRPFQQLVSGECHQRGQSFQASGAAVCQGLKLSNFLFILIPADCMFSSAGTERPN